MRKASMRKRHHDGSEALSPEMVNGRKTFSNASAPEKRSSTGWVHHVANSRPNGAIASTCIDTSVVQSRCHGDASLASASRSASTEATVNVAGDVQLTVSAAGSGSVASSTRGERPTWSGIENQAGAERPKRSANSTATPSNLACWPVAR